MSTAAISAKGAWTIDASHSEITFKVKHLVVTTVTGKFDKFEGNLESPSDDFNDAKISFTAYADSINTSNEQRDTHLKSDDFFNAEKFPKISFVSTSFKKVSGNTYKLIGDFTMRDTTKSIELTAEFGGIVVDPWGNTKAGFEINGTVNRKEFGLKWGALTEAGGAVVSDEVKLHMNVELHKQS